MAVAVETQEKILNTNSTGSQPILISGGRAYLVVKRFFDVAVAMFAFLLLLVPMMVIAVCIKLDSKGPVIFRQERLGLDGKPFIMLKFRSMVVDAEANGPCWAEKDDDRCTKIGRLLRKTRLDELPQLYNIIVGEMSFVGPRPERACFYDEFEKYIPDFRKRLLVKPGLTGHAQVNGGYELRPEEKLAFDMEYMAKRSIGLDLLCMIKTVRLMFTHEGAR